METQKCEFYQKVGNQRNWILSVPRVSILREKKSPWLCQYQSYISNWYVNGKVFQYYNMGTKTLSFFFSKKVRNWSWLVLKSWNQHSSRFHLYVDIGDASSSLWGSTSSFYSKFSMLCTTMDSSQRALQNDEKFSPNSKLVFEILIENRKIFKRIARSE